MKCKCKCKCKCNVNDDRVPIRMFKGGQLAGEARIVRVHSNSKLIRSVWNAFNLLPKVSLHEYTLLWIVLREGSTDITYCEF